ncbi:unnamed protein product [Gadus morhua 'NCC']
MDSTPQPPQLPSQGECLGPEIRPLCLSPQIYPPCLRLTMTQALHVPVSVYMVTLPSSFTGPHYTPVAYREEDLQGGGPTGRRSSREEVGRRSCREEVQQGAGPAGRRSCREEVQQGGGPVGRRSGRDEVQQGGGREEALQE